MSGIEVAGLVFGVVPILFKATVEAWQVLDEAIAFHDDIEDCAIRLETVKARLGIWATRTGLINGTLTPTLQPLEELLERTLKRIHDLVSEAKRHGDRYGMKSNDVPCAAGRRLTSAVSQMRRSLNAAILSSRAGSELAASMAAGSKPILNSSSMSKRLYWAVHDRDKFYRFVDTLERHIRNLELLSADSDRKIIQQEGTRLALDIINGLSQPEALAQLQTTSGWDDSFAQIDVNSLARWKSISLQRALTMAQPSGTPKWTLVDSWEEERSRHRFLRKGSDGDGSTYLFEKKEYDNHISDELKDVLRERIRKLVSLLSGSGSARKLNTLQACAYIDDPEYNCWWIIFRFQACAIDSFELSRKEPLSLHDLLSSPLRPPLEVRYKLAKRLADTFAWLYGSGWMHKGISSSNIIFPLMYREPTSATFHALPQALVQGFNYSRELTQSQTIDRGKVLNDLEAAIYRHPKYQGEAASGYEIQYDIYSLGLVLLEIALWGPLMDFLKPRKEKVSTTALSPTMRTFHEAEALELKRRAMIRIEHELAYRVGSSYKEIVKWCLNLEGPVTAIDFFNMVAVPLDTLCSV